MNVVALGRNTLFILGLIIFFGACSDTTTSNPEQGRVTFEITDSPVDAAEVEAVFVTVSEIQLDGQAIRGVNRQTIEISSLTDGRTVELVAADVNAEAYTNFNLVLDLEQDVNGNNPGCYVRTTDGTIHPLQTTDASTTTLNLAQPQELSVTAGSDQAFVIDLDLRKSIRIQNNATASDRYDFVNQAEIISAFRLLRTDAVSSIDGSAQYDGLDEASTVIVYAYEQGTFSQAEASPRGSGQIRFSGAVTSSRVAADGTYSLSFLEPGNYELIFAAFRDENGDDLLDYQGRVDVALTGGLDVNLRNFELNASQRLELNLRLIGLL